MSEATRTIRLNEMLSGSRERMHETFIPSRIHWSLVCRFILAALVSLGIAYGIGLTGGLIAVIAVLFMPVLPHSPTLALMRGGAAVVGFGAGWLLAYQFVDQPWALFAILMLNGYFWFYMMANGLPFLTMMLLGMMPVLVCWMVYSGHSDEDVSHALAEFLCGVGGSELVALTWRNTGEQRLLKLSAASLRDFASELRDNYGLGRPDQITAGRSRWVPGKNLGFNNLLGIARAELGEHAHEYKRLCCLVAHVRYLLIWPKVYDTFVRGGHFDQWMIDLEPERMRIHDAIAATVEDLARGLESGRPASPHPDLEDAFRTLDERTTEWLEKNRSALSLRTISLIEARCQYGQSAIEALGRIGAFTRREDEIDPTLVWTMPRPTFLSIFLDFNPKSGLFAFKALICVAIGFIIASIFYQWPGSVIILLMCGFLAPLTIGGLNVMFIDRIWGLLAAVVTCGFSILVIIPNLTQVGELLLLVGVVMMPGIVLALVPKTASMGLSYAMAVLFILTGSKHPSADLDPLQIRFLSVAGATLICYVVFLVVIPVKARDLVTERLHGALAATSRMIRQCRFFADPERRDSVETTASRHAAIAAGGNFSQLLEELHSESNAPERLLRMRSELVDDVNTCLALAAANSILTEHPLFRKDTHIAEMMDDVLEGLSASLSALAEYTAGNATLEDVNAAYTRVDGAIEREKQLILRIGIADRFELDDPERLHSRIILAEYSHHFAMLRVQRRLLRRLQMRDALHVAVQAEAVGRTA